MPGAALAVDPITTKPLAACAAKVPSRPTVGAVRVSPSVVPVSGSQVFGTISFNITSPTPNNEPAFLTLGIYQGGLQRFGTLAVDTTGCTSNVVSLAYTTSVASLEQLDWKPNTLYTVYVLNAYNPSGTLPPYYAWTFKDQLRFLRETPLLKAPAAAFWTKKAPPATTPAAS